MFLSYLRIKSRFISANTGVKNYIAQQGMVTHACSPSTVELEARAPRLQKETLPRRIRKELNLLYSSVLAVTIYSVA